jgi:hypothetical protein
MNDRGHYILSALGQDNSKSDPAQKKNRFSITNVLYMHMMMMT